MSQTEFKSLVIDNVGIGYDEKIVLKNLNFSFPLPIFCAIIGHNGSGKSTLLKAIAGKIPYTGAMHFSSNKHNSRSEILNDEVVPHSPFFGYLEQQKSLTFPLKVIDLVVMGRFRHKTFFQNYDHQDIALASKNLDLLKISHLKNRLFSELSGGEQQLIWLAQLLVHDAEILLLDEPTQHLDIRFKKRLFDIFKSIVAEQKKSIFCVTHDLLDLEEMEGVLLNVSKENPQIEQISKTTLEENKLFLQHELSFQI